MTHTISEDIGFLRALAVDIHNQEQGEVGDYIVDHLEALADRLTQLDNISVELKLAILEDVAAQELTNTEIPEDYHCGDETCEACNEAAAELEARGGGIEVDEATFTIPGLLTGPEAT